MIGRMNQNGPHLLTGLWFDEAGPVFTAVAAAIIGAENQGTGKAGAAKLIAEAGSKIEGTPYEAFLDRYFAETR